MVLGIPTKQYLFFLDREKNRYWLVGIPRTMGWYLEVVTYGTARYGKVPYGATGYGTVRYFTVPSYIVKVRYRAVRYDTVR